MAMDLINNVDYVNNEFDLVGVLMYNPNMLDIGI